MLHRHVVAVLLLGALAVVSFVGTRTIAGTNARLRARDAARWHEVGQHQLAAGNGGAAVPALRRATTLDRQNREYRLALASALIAAGKPDDARRVLLRVRDVSPERADVNLRLARLDAGRQDVAGAIRYYQSALYGMWNPDEVANRRRVRVEFIKYLLANHQQSLALSELLVLEGQLADEPAAYKETGRLFLAAGDDARALGYFERALRANPRDDEALAGAGKAAFELRDYARAWRFLRATPDKDVADLRVIAELVVTRDPLAAQLAAVSRVQRTQINARELLQWRDRCTTERPIHAESWSADVEALRRLEQSLRRRRRTPPLPHDTLTEAVDLMARLARRVATACGDQWPLGRALILIGERHSAEQ